MTIINKCEDYFERGLLLQLLPPSFKKLLRLSAVLSPDLVPDAVPSSRVLLGQGRSQGHLRHLGLQENQCRKSPCTVLGERFGLVYGQPAVKTPRLTLLGVRPSVDIPRRAGAGGLQGAGLLQRWLEESPC